jgi:uroporphyrinogen decarboxylase
MHRQVPDRVPVDLSWGMTYEALERFRHETGADDPDDYFRLDVRFVSPELSKGWGATRGVDDAGALDPAQAEKEATFRRYLGDFPPNASITEWGVGHVRESEYHFVRFVHPLADALSPDDIAAYPFPAFDEAWRIERLRDQIDACHERDLCVGGMAASTIFETGWQLRGMERLFEDMLTCRERATALFDRITTIRCAMAQTLVRTGVDVLVLGDDVAMQHEMMMSPALWRQWLRPRLAQVIDAARRIRRDVPVLYHSDGNLNAIIPELIEIGVDILNPVQPECMDPAALKVQFGDRVAFWGTIGTQTTMPFGTPRQVKDEVRRRIETVGRGGGLLLGPSHSLQPDVPWANIMAFFEAAEEYGRYK